MSIVKLTENLENFKWTEYNKIGDDTDIDPNKGGVHGSTKDKLFPHQTEHSIHDDGIGSGTYPNDNPQSYTVRGDIVTGNKSFYRPAESALVNMESEFGPLNTQPPDRGPYGVTDYMDGTQQGQGFIPPGGPPLGFTVDMGVSEYAIGDPLNYTLTPLSHTIAAVNSNGPHGSVTEQTINLTPVAPNAWAEDFMTTPLAEYVSQYSEPVVSLTHGVDMITLTGPTTQDYQTELNVTPKVEDAHGSDFMTLPLKGYTSGLSPKPDSVIDTIYDRSLAYISNISEPNEPIFKQFSRGSAGLNIFGLTSPNFDGFTFTEEIPYVIPQHTSTGPEQFTIEPFDNTPKLEHAHSTDPLSRLLDYPGLYVGSAGDILQGEDVIPSISSPNWGWTSIGVIGGGNRYYGGLESLYDKSSMFEDKYGKYMTPDGVNLTVQGNQKKFQSFSGEGGKSFQRTFNIPHSYPDNDFLYSIDTQFGWSHDSKFLTNHGSSWRNLPNGDDISRIEKWLETPSGQQWQEKQHMLQELNPREETRNWSRSNLIRSIPSLFHATRHFGGETYMDTADFGPLIGGTSQNGTTLGSILGAKFGFKFSKLVGDLKTASEKFNKFNTLLGDIDFNSQGAGGRLKFLRDRFILGDTKKDGSISIGKFGDINTTALRNSTTPFGRPPKIPTQTTFSQRGAFGKGSIHIQDGSKGVGGEGVSAIHKYKALAYGELGGKYLPHSSPLPSHGRELTAGEPRLSDFAAFSPEPGAEIDDKAWESAGNAYEEQIRLFDKDLTEIDQLNKSVEAHRKGLEKFGKITTQIGDAGKQNILGLVTDTTTDGSGLGIIKKNLGSTGIPGENYKSIATDKINIHPYGKDLPEDVSDFVKFKFKDIVNTKFLIFRALLSGISDSITPEWTGTRYIGRPDQVYVYSGTERKVSFNFDIYPKTKQEFPVLLEKLNYLIGLCYPSFTPDNRMIAPFIELTIGDMFVDTPGFLDSLSVSVEDNSTWEIEDGLQFPKYIKCDCSFTYVGKYMPSTLGKHYELGWLDDKGWSLDKDGTGTKGTFTSEENVDKSKNSVKNVDKLNRIEPMAKLFSGLG